jgi:hypothetical protein
MRASSAAMSNKKLNFQELAKSFTPMPNYRVNVMWDYLEQHLEHWAARGDEGMAQLDLDPDFQRGHVWTPEQQTAYIEYILKGGMSGREIYFNCTGWMKDWRGPFVIVDGKQRLHAAREFMANRVPVFGGHYRKDIEGRLSLNAQFLFNVNDLKTRAEVLKWYLEMNTGGTPHTADEIEKVQSMLKSCAK